MTCEQSKRLLRAVAGSSALALCSDAGMVSTPVGIETIAKFTVPPDRRSLT